MWKVAEEIADQFAELARSNPGVLSSYAHLFLDHLHGISSSSNAYGNDAVGSYPTHILESLCSTMSLLTKKERGIYSLLMITIQKQLMSRAGGSGMNAAPTAFRSTENASVVDLRQLMAVFLAGYLLKNAVVVDERDRKSLGSWMMRLLSATSRDETLLHVIRFVRGELIRVQDSDSANGIGEASSTSALGASLAQIFRKRGFVLLNSDQTRRRTDEGFSLGASASTKSTKTDNPIATFVLDVAEFVSKMRFGVPHVGRHDIPTENQVESMTALVQHQYAMKIFLLRELYHCRMMDCSDSDIADILSVDFLFPKAYSTTVEGDHDDPVDRTSFNAVMWSLICALDISVESTNILTQQYFTKGSSWTEDDANRQLELIEMRLQVSLNLRDQLERVLATQKFQLHTAMNSLPANDSSKRIDSERRDLEWFLTEVSIAELLLNDAIRPIQGEPPCASLHGLDLRVITLTFQNQWKKTGAILPLAHELALLQAMHRHLQPANVLATHANGNRRSCSTDAKVEQLVARTEGRRSLKYLTARAEELGHAVSDSVYNQDEDRDLSDDGEHDNGVSSASSLIQDVVINSLRSIYGIIQTVLDESTLSDPRRVPVVERVIELLAAGVTSRRLRLAPKQASIHREILLRHLSRQCLVITVSTRVIA